MRLKRKHRSRVTRKASRFTIDQMRSPFPLRSYRAGLRGAVNEPRYRRRFNPFRLTPLFHDSTARLDPLASLFRYHGSYSPLLADVAEGQTDHRLFHPDNDFRHFVSGRSSQSLSPARTSAVVGKKSSRVLVSPPSPVVVPSGETGQYLQFNLPRQVLVCVRRHQRREVLFATRKAGGRFRKPKWNDDSYIRC